MEIENCPPVSRRELRRQDRRDAILTVAAESFLNNGYAGTTMSSIAATLGGSKGTLWSYFSSKEELFAEVIDQATSAYRAHLSEILDAPCDDLRQTLTRICASILGKVMKPESISLQRLVVSEAGRFPEMGTIFFNRGPGMTHRLLADFMANEMKLGRLRSDDPMTAARTLSALTVYGYQQRMLWGLLDHADPVAMRAEVDHGVDLFLRAYAP